MNKNVIFEYKGKQYDDTEKWITDLVMDKVKEQINNKIERHMNDIISEGATVRVIVNNDSQIEVKIENASDELISKIKSSISA